MSDDIKKLIDKSLDTLEDALLHMRRVFSDRMIKQEDIECALPLPRLLKSPQDKKRIILLGSGWAAHAFLKIIETDIYEVICISPRPYFIFTPMLAATAVGTVEYRSIVEPIRISNPLVDYIEGEAIDIDPVLKTVSISSAVLPVKATVQKSGIENSNIIEPFTIAYDHIIVSVGVKNNDFGLEGVAKYCSFIKEIKDVQKLRSKILLNFEAASLPETAPEEACRLLTFAGMWP